LKAALAGKVIMSAVIESDMDPSKKQRSKRGTAVTLEQWAMPSASSQKEMIPEFSQLQAHQKKVVVRQPFSTNIYPEPSII